MQIAKDTVVFINYTLTGDDGSVIDSSEESPLAYLHGHDNIIPGLENQLTGKNKGDKLQVTIPPKDGYGEVNTDLVKTVPREHFDEITELEIGLTLRLTSPTGEMDVTVTDVKDATVTIDGNHPLAGKNLNFAVDVVDVRAASAEELEHGHPHTGEGHC